MALTVGELTAYTDVDDRGVDRGLDATHRHMARFQQETLRDFELWAEELGTAMGDGILNAVRNALNSARGQLRNAGDDAGDDVGDGIIRGADDAIRAGAGDLSASARRAAGQAGDDAGDAFGDGLRDGADQGADEAVGAAEGRLSKLKGGAAAAGLLAGAALMQGVTDAMDQGRILSHMEASMGATPELMEKYGQAAGELFANAVTADFQTAADAVAETMNHGLLPTEATMGQIETMATGLADVASLMGEEVGPTARAVGKMIKTGLVDDGAEALDILTRGVQTGANEAEDLLDTFSEYSTQFRQLGLSGDEAMGLISQGLQGGARDADVIADTLKEGTLIWQDMGDEAATAMETLGLSASEMQDAFTQGGPAARDALDEILDRLRDVKDPTDRAALALDLFGTKFEDIQDALFSLDPSEATAALGDVSGAAEDAGNTMRDNAGAKIEAFKRQLQQGLVNVLGNEVIPALQDLKREWGPTLQAGADATADFWTRAQPYLQQAQDGLSGLSDGFRGVQTDSATSMSSTQQTVYTTMTQLGSTLSSAQQFIRDGWRMFGSDLWSTATLYWGYISSEWQGLLGIVKGFLSVWAGVFSGDWRKVWDGARNVFSGAWGMIEGRARAGWGMLQALGSAGMSLLRGMWDAGWGAIKAGASAAWRWVVDDTKAWLGRMRDRTSSGISSVVSIFNSLKSRVQGALSGASDWLFNAGKAIIQGLIDGLESALGGLLDTVGGIAGDITSHFPFSPAKRGPLREHPPNVAGETIGTMLADGLRSSLSTVAGAASLTAGAAVVSAPSAVGGAPMTAAPHQCTHRFVFDVTGGDDDIVRMLRGWIDNATGGDVQQALGRNGG